jgi:hypothetical protein
VNQREWALRKMLRRIFRPKRKEKNQRLNKMQNKPKELHNYYFLLLILNSIKSSRTRCEERNM